MKQLFTTILLCTLLIAAASPAAAQADSLFAVRSSGTTILRVDEAGGFLVRGAQDQGLLPATGPGVRMMWFPGRYAFRVGMLDTDGPGFWDLSEVGYGSVAMGHNVRADGVHAFAVGYGSRAAGGQSVAMGNNATASGDRSFAFGGTASGARGIALGNGAQATGPESVALGSGSISGGLASFAASGGVARGTWGTAIGYRSDASGNYSVAIGRDARSTLRSGSIVLSDACAGFTSDSVYPTTNNQFVVRGCGGLRMYTSQNLSSGVQVAAGGSSWSSVSDVNRKENFVGVDGEEILARLRSVPVSTWNYLTQDDSIRHLGPMAQDFYAAFEVGESDLLINSVDIDGVNMAAAQALTARTDALWQEVHALREENLELRARLERLEQQMLRGDAH